MKRNAYADSTIKATGKRLKHLQKHCDLTKPEEVKTFIANKNCTNAFKDHHRNYTKQTPPKRCCTPLEKYVIHITSHKTFVVVA
jgi:hypothetical protein